VRFARNPRNRPVRLPGQPSIRLNTRAVRVNVQRAECGHQTTRLSQPPVAVAQKLRLSQDTVEGETERPSTTLAL